MLSLAYVSVHVDVCISSLTLPDNITIGDKGLQLLFNNRKSSS